MKRQILIMMTLAVMSFSVMSQDTDSSEVKATEEFGEMMEKILFTEIVFDKPTENFTPKPEGDGFEEESTGAKIVGMYFPAPFEDVLEDFQSGEEDDPRVIGSGSFEMDGVKGYYNEMIYKADKKKDDDFVGILVILPGGDGTINVTAVCPKPHYKKYKEDFIKAAKTAKIKE